MGGGKHGESGNGEVWHGEREGGGNGESTRRSTRWNREQYTALASQKRKNWDRMAIKGGGTRGSHDTASETTVPPTETDRQQHPLPSTETKQSNRNSEKVNDDGRIKTHTNHANE